MKYISAYFFYCLQSISQQVEADDSTTHQDNFMQWQHISDQLEVAMQFYQQPNEHTNLSIAHSRHYQGVTNRDLEYETSQLLI